MYSFLLERQQQAAVTKASTMSRNRILDAAVVPYREDSPALGIRLMAALLLGVLGSAAFAVVRGWLGADVPERGRARARAAAAGRRAVAARAGAGSAERLAAPAVSARAACAGAELAPPAEASVAFAPTSAFAEAFRHLRTNLYLAGRPARAGAAGLVSQPGRRQVGVRARAGCRAGRRRQARGARRRRHAPPGPRRRRAARRGSAGLAEVLVGRRHWSDVVRARIGGHAVRHDPRRRALRGRGRVALRTVVRLVCCSICERATTSSSSTHRRFRSSSMR